MSDDRLHRRETPESDPWFRKAFGPFYQDLYGHRDDIEARAAVRILAAHLPIAPGPAPKRPVLDIACGAGRHLKALDDEGLHGIGLDLSWFLLKSAPDCFRGRLIRADMRRLPFRDEAFGAAISMFTSFGYFTDPEENRRVLGEAARVLAPGGGLAVDYFNSRTTLESLVAEGSRIVGRYDVRESRRLSETPAGITRIIKTVEILDGADPLETWREEVMVLTPEMITRLVEESGFEIVARFGDYNGTPFDGSTSPRFFLLARRRSS